MNELWNVEGEFPPVPSCFSLLVPVLLSYMYMLMDTLSTIMQKETAKSLHVIVPRTNRSLLNMNFSKSCLRFPRTSASS